jgi:hypothetical protein
MQKVFHFLLLLTFSWVYSQGEANIWYFGFQAGVDFSSGSPIALTDSQMNAFEGCTTISNSAGQLLFYSNGLSVWDANHQVMPNGSGLLSDQSSTQAAIAIPRPNSSSYYLFTTDALGNANGARYSEIDMNLNGGLGDVTANKNILLFSPSCEKVTAVKHQNGIDYWVIFHELSFNNNFRSYLVSASGVSAVPVISSSGTSLPIFSASYSNAGGYLKFSPNGDKLINCINVGLVELFDFDATTGIISNPRLVCDNLPNYGVEFSPSGSIAYITSGYGATYQLLQFDLTSANIQSTELLIHQLDFVNIYQFGGLQLGPDGKIYVAITNLEYLSVINNPDVLGLGSNFSLNAVSLQSKICRSGLPQFIQSYFNSGISAQNNCLGEISNFTLTNNQTGISVVWDFGDGSDTS